MAQHGDSMGEEGSMGPMGEESSHTSTRGTVGEAPTLVQAPHKSKVPWRGHGTGDLRCDPTSRFFPTPNLDHLAVHQGGV